MISKELDEALIQLKKENETYTQLQKEYDCAREKWQPLEQADAEVHKTELEHDKALKKWRKLDKQFDDEHSQLIDAIDDARDTWYEAKQRVKKIIDKLTEVNND